MTKILAFGASNSSTSINHKFALWTAKQLKDVEIVELKMGSYDLPIFGVDLEKEIGQHKEGQRFLDEISAVDGIVISLAEHNGGLTAAFKNLLDWASRIESKVWQGKPLFVLSTSPGKRGGANVMDSFLKQMPHMGAEIVSSFSLPSYYSNFEETNGKLDSQLNESFEAALDKFTTILT